MKYVGMIDYKTRQNLTQQSANWVQLFLEHSFMHRYINTDMRISQLKSQVSFYSSH